MTSLTPRSAKVTALGIGALTAAGAYVLYKDISKKKRTKDEEFNSEQDSSNATTYILATCACSLLLSPPFLRLTAKFMRTKRSHAIFICALIVVGASYRLYNTISHKKIHGQQQAIHKQFQSAVQKQNLSLIKRLVEQYAQLHLLNIISSDGNAVLHVAVTQNNHDFVQYLLSQGVFVNAQNPINGDTPLHIASRMRYRDIISLLMEYNANCEILNHSNETALSIARALSKDYSSIVDTLSVSVNTLSAPISSADAIEPDVVAAHNRLETGIWIIIGGCVFDITRFIESNLHPPTNAFIRQYYGKDATEAFDAMFHSVDAVNILKKYEIGQIPDDGIANMSSMSLRSLRPSVSSFDLRRKSHNISVKQIWIYPIKGCKGISMKSAELSKDGFVDDRIYAFVNKTTNVTINQLTYPRLALINVAFKDGTNNCDSGIQVNDLFVPFIKEKSLKVAWRSCSTPLLVYDQGDDVSKWITSFINESNETSSDSFILVRIHEANYRETEEYFSLSFAPRSAQKMSAFQNYASVLLGSEESMTELNRRYKEREGLTDDDEKEIKWDRFRKNIIISGVPMAHYEDFMKHIRFGDTLSDSAEILWSRRRYFCAMPQVNQNNAVQTLEPIGTVRRYRNAITLNDRTSLPGDDAVFFGSFYCVKHSGNIRIGQSVISEHEELSYDTVRTASGKSYYGLTESNIGSQFIINYHTQYQPFELCHKEQYNHDVLSLTFKMIIKKELKYHKSVSDSFKMGDHYLFKFVDFDGNLIIRAYTPISVNEMSFDLLVKVYPKGKMSQHLNNMEEGDTILCKKNYGKISYLEIGKMRFGDPRFTMFLPYTLSVNKVNLIAAGSGITPIYQIINNINLNKEYDETQISLIYANQSIKDILLKDKLQEIAKANHNIKIHFVVQNTNKTVHDIHIGRITMNLCRKYLFPPNKKDDNDVVNLLCGPLKMEDDIKKCLHQIGYDEKTIATF